MNRSLRFLISLFGAVCMGCGVSLFTACEGCSGDNPKYGVEITTPAPTAPVSSLTTIAGTYIQDNELLTEVRLQLVRYSDGAFWTTNAEWGGSGSTVLPTDTSTYPNWQSTGAMPSGPDLPDGYYNIIAIAKYENDVEERRDSIFAVGVVSPPVTPALYGSGENEFGQLGAGTFPSSPTLIPVNMRGVLEGKIVVAVSSGSEHNLALTSEGLVYSWGFNVDKQLGNGPAVFATERFPVAVDTSTALNGKKVTGISAGYGHSLAVDKDGVVYAWGSGLSGALGNNDTSNTGVGQAIAVGGALVGKKVREVAAGLGSSLARTEDGLLYAWGYNDRGQLGIGSTVTTPTPTAVTGLAGKYVYAVSAKDKHVLALTRNGLGAVEVYAWGPGTNGQLGNGGTADSSVPVLVGGALAGKEVIAVAAGQSFSMALAEDKVYVWGRGEFGQLGNGTSGVSAQVNVPTLVGGDLTGKKVVRIGAGNYFCYAVTQDNRVYAWGRNAIGALAGISGDPVTMPTEADFSAALTGGRTVIGLSAGLAHTIALTSFEPLPSGDIVVEPVQNGLQAPAVSGATISFGTRAVGSFTPRYIVVRNVGNGALTNLSAPNVGGSYFNFFSTPSLLPGNTTGFYVFFNPQTAGTHNATLQINSSDKKNSPFILNLQATAVLAGGLDNSSFAGLAGEAEPSSSFADPNIIGTVSTTAVQSDGGVLLGGAFTSVSSTTRNHIARLNSDGSLDVGFNPNCNGEVSCIVVQPDGKIVIAGAFTTVGGITRNGIARLNDNGTLDTTFNPNATGQILSLALQGDGKIIVAGSFTNIASSGRSRLVRLLPGGGVDDDFNPVVSDTVRTVAVLTSGQIIIGGDFFTVGGFAHSRLARLEVNGDVDGVFDAQVSGGPVSCLAVQANGKVLAGGSFTTVNTFTRNSLARFNVDGSLETGFQEFNPEVIGTVNTLAVQVDGDIMLGGSFMTVGGTGRNNLARVKSNGSLDFYFDPNMTGAVSSLALQSDGRIIAGGAFTQVGGTARASLARLTNQTASQQLGVPNTGTIEWLREDASPEVQQVLFEVSSDGGTTWTPLGAASRINFGQPGWRMTGAVMPTSGHVRALAICAGGQNSGSSSLLAASTAYGEPPEIEITSTGGNTHTNFSSRDFGVASTGTGFKDVDFTITNTGVSPLTGLSAANITGANAASFKISAIPAPSVAGNGGTTTLSVRFNPRSERTQTALLTIPSNDPDESSFQITLTGDGGIDVANWKIQKGIAGTADMADTDNDGLVTLIEDALGTNPTERTEDLTTFLHDSGGGTLTFTYPRNKLALGDLIIQVEWSDTLAGNDWHTTGVTEDVLSELDYVQQVQATVPAGTAGRRFVRLKITRP